MIAPHPAEIYQIDHRSCLDHTTDLAWDGDPRGIVWIFEPPLPKETYVIAVDPSKGIPGWHRALRREEDRKTDNGAIEVVRKGKPGHPDVQVAEFAAPIDPYDLAPYVNALGRLYKGRDEEGQALAIIEVWPGPGLMTQRELLEKFGYTHLFIWKYLDQYGVKQTASLGWTSSPKSVRDLWIMATHHIEGRKAVIQSPWLLEEMVDCAEDPIKQYGKARRGAHDDRVRAFMMGEWALHDWTGQVETVPSDVKEHKKALNWQATDMSYEEMMRVWNEQFEEMVGE